MPHSAVEISFSKSLIMSVFILCWGSPVSGEPVTEVLYQNIQEHTHRNMPWPDEMDHPRILDGVDVALVIDEREGNFPFVVYRISFDGKALSFVYKSQVFTDYIENVSEGDGKDIAKIFVRRFEGILNDLEARRWRPEMGLVPWDLTTPDVFPLLPQMRLLIYAIDSLESYIVRSGGEVTPSTRLSRSGDHRFWTPSQWSDWEISDSDLLDMRVCRRLELKILLDGRMMDLPFVIFDVRCGTARRFVYRESTYWDFVVIDDGTLWGLDEDETAKVVASYFADRFRGIANDLKYGRMRGDLPGSWFRKSDFHWSADHFLEASSNIEASLALRAGILVPDKP